MLDGADSASTHRASIPSQLAPHTSMSINDSAWIRCKHRNPTGEPRNQIQRRITRCALIQPKDEALR